MPEPIDPKQDLFDDLTPEQEAALEWLFDLPPRKFEIVLRRLNLEVNDPAEQMSDEQISAEVEKQIRSRFPDAPADACTWTRWPE